MGSLCKVLTVGSVRRVIELSDCDQGDKGRPGSCCPLLEAWPNSSHPKHATRDLNCVFFSPVPENLCRRLQTSPLPGVHHRPLHGVPASCGAEALPQHAAIHLRDTVQEGKHSCMMGQDLSKGLCQGLGLQWLIIRWALCKFMVALRPEVCVVVFNSGGAVEDGAESQTGDGQVLAGHHRGDRTEEQGSAGQRDGGVLHFLPEGWCPFSTNGVRIVLPSGS